LYIHKPHTKDQNLTPKEKRESGNDSTLENNNNLNKKIFQAVKDALVEQMGRFINMIVFLIYPGLSVKIFTIFKCIELDKGTYYLMQDLSVRCYDSNWNAAAAVAAICIIVYVIGIPAVTFFLLHRNKDTILDGTAEEQDALKKIYGSLYNQYEGRYYWWEVAEMIKKMLLTGGLVLLAPGSTAQILVGVLITLVYFSFVMKLEPYEDYSDDILQTISTVQILLTLLMGFALRSDDNGLYESGTITFILIFANSILFMTTSYLIIKTTAQMRGLFWRTFCCCLHTVNKKGKAFGDKVSSVAIQPLKRRISSVKSVGNNDRNNFTLPKPPPGPPPTATKDTSSASIN
jgi:hypothetical protein